MPAEAVCQGNCIELADQPDVITQAVKEGQSLKVRVGARTYNAAVQASTLYGDLGESLSRVFWSGSPSALLRTAINDDRMT